MFNLENNIVPLVYATNCSGTVTLDKSNTSVSPAYVNSLRIQDAMAQKFIPTSKCLHSVKLNLRVESSLVDEGAYVQIRRNVSGLPNGNPADSNYLAQSIIPRGLLTTSFADITFPLNLELQDIDLINGLWIIILNGVYDPNYITETTSYLEVNGTSTGSNESIFKVSTDAWQLLPGKSYYITFKQTFCTTPTCSFTVT